MTINQALDKAIVRREVKAKQLARHLAVSTAALSYYRRGKRNVPPDVAARAALCLGCPELLQVFCAGCPVSGAWKTLRERRGAA